MLPHVCDDVYDGWFPGVEGVIQRICYFPWSLNSHPVAAEIFGDLCIVEFSEVAVKKFVEASFSRPQILVSP